MKPLTREHRIAKAERYLREGVIIQGSWRKVVAGRQMVCALSAFGEDINNSKDCPADLMPRWLAELVPQIDDGIDAREVHCYATGLIARAKKWDKLDKEAWERIKRRFRDALYSAGTYPSHSPAVELNALAGMRGSHTAMKATHKQFGQQLFAFIDEELAKVR